MNRDLSKDHFHMQKLSRPPQQRKRENYLWQTHNGVMPYIIRMVYMRIARMQV